MKNLLLKRYTIKDNGIEFDLKFLDKLTLINGASGLGKTMLFKAMENDALVSQTNMLCLNYDDIQSGNIAHVLATAKGKIIVIDNADIALDIAQRIRVSKDNENQYIIFTHMTDGYKPTEKSIARMVIDGKKGYLDYYLVRK